jgi:hypothetical protein
MTCRTTGKRSEPDRKSFAAHPWQNRIHRSGRRKSASEYSAKIIKTLNYKAFVESMDAWPACCTMETVLFFVSARLVLFAEHQLN